MDSLPKTYQHDWPNKRVGASVSEDQYFLDQYSSPRPDLSTRRVGPVLLTSTPHHDQYFLGRRPPRRPTPLSPMPWTFPRPFSPFRSDPITSRFFFPEFNLPIGQPRDERPPTEPEPCPQQPIVRRIFRHMIAYIELRFDQLRQINRYFLLCLKIT